MRTIRTMTAVLAAGVVALATAGSALAAPHTITTFPAKVTVAPGDTVTLSYTSTGICVTTAWTWSYTVVGQRSGIAPAPAAPLACSGDTVSLTLTAATPTTPNGKANSVVKLVATPVAPSTAESVVLTTVVKVGQPGGKPAGKPGGKPGR